MEPNKLTTLIAIITIVFLIMPIFMLAYFWIYTRKKKNHLEEKTQLKANFEQEMLTAQQEAREQTMQTIGADLHDNIGQLLSLTALTLKSVPYENESRTKEKVASSIELLSKAITEMRQLGKLLQGDQLLAAGLETAIEQEVNWLSKSANYKLRFSIGDPAPVRNPDIDLFYFRILQEILNNIIKHAEATHIDIRLHYQHGMLELTVADDGIGFIPTDQHSQGSGLANIKKRTLIVGGQADIESQPGKGTTITIQTPYP